jgi:hypothetical protein
MDLLFNYTPAPKSSPPGLPVPLTMAGKGLQALRAATEIANVYAPCSGVAAVAAFFTSFGDSSQHQGMTNSILAPWITK